MLLNTAKGPVSAANTVEPIIRPSAVVINVFLGKQMRFFTDLG